jgi:hypothetical protein
MSSPTPEPASRWPDWLPASLVLGLLVAWYGGAAWLRPTRRAIGSAWSEAPGHLWGLWTTAAGVLEHGPLVRVAPGLGFPEGFEAHLVDPVNMLLYLPGYALGGGGLSGAVLGWNLLHAGAIVVGGLGCMAAARAVLGRAHGTPWSAALLTAAFCGGAFLLSHPHMGRSEYLPAVLLPWHVALLWRWVRGDAGWRIGVAAGLLLGGVGLGGSYLAIFALLFELPLALGLLAMAGAERRRVLGRLALVAAVALVVTLPMVAALLMYPPPGSSPLLSAPPRPMAESDPGTLLTMLRLGPLPDLEPLLDQPPYPGLVLLGLALVGAVLRPRRALGWLLLGLWLAVLSLGAGIATNRGGQPGMILLPAGWLQSLAPPLANLKTWSRLACMVPLPLGLAAIHGVQALLRRVSRSWLHAGLGFVLVAAVLADQASWPRRSSLERPVFEPAAPADLLELTAQLPPGAVIQLPLEVSIGKGIKLQAARSHLWQLQHGRPITATPGVISDTSLRWSFLARLAVNRQFTEAGRGGRRGQPPLPGARGSLDAESLACARADAAALHAKGISALVLLEDEPAAEALYDLLEQVLGAPDHLRGDVQAWSLDGWADHAGAPCELPPVPGKVHMMLGADGGPRAMKGPGGPPPPMGGRR